MARKSPWQQFGDNFDSTYGTFNKMFQGIETAGIMREKPEEEIIQEGPRNSYERATGKWTYGGQTYDEPISQEQLTGLRNERLTNVMTKYGDIKGGMDLQLRQKELEQKTIANQIAKETMPDVIEHASQKTEFNELGLSLNKIRIDQAKAEHQLYMDTLDATERLAYATALGAELTTDGQIVAVDIARATKDDVIRGVALGVRAQEIANVNAELAGAGLRIDNDGKLVALDITKATKDFKIEGERLDNAKKILENIGLKVTNEGDLLDLKKSKELFEAEVFNAKLKLQVEEQELKAKQAFNQVYADHAAKSKLEPEEGGFSNQKEANKALMDALVGVPGGDALVRDLENDYRTHELAGIIHQGTVLKQKTDLALQKGGIDGLAEEIDKMNGIDKDIRVDRKGSGVDTVVTLTEVDPDGRTLRVIATGKEKNADGSPGDFYKNLDMALDPANMMETAKEYYDILKVQADTAYTKAAKEHKEQETKGLKNAKAEFDKEDFFIRLLMENPEDTMAWAGLVGMDLSMGEIEEKVIERRSLIALDSASGGDGDDTSATDGGLAQNSTNVLFREDPPEAPLHPLKKTDVNWMGKATELSANPELRKDRAGYSEHTKVQVDLKESESIQNKQMQKANKEVSQRVNKIVEYGLKPLKKWTKDTNLSASDRMAQELRYRLKDWLEENPYYFFNNVSQLDAFEKNPDKWFQATIEYEQDKTYGL